MKSLTTGIILVMPLLALPCLAQTPIPDGPVIQVTHTPLPVIINGKRSDPSNESNAPMPGSTPLKNPSVSAQDLSENLITFNPDLLELDWNEGRWQLLAGQTRIRDFGQNVNAAQQMLLLLRQLRVNQYGWVGQDQPILEYWLSNGQSPQGLTSGLRMSSLDPESLRVEKFYGQWCLRDAYRTLFCFERSEEDAQKALAILRKYRFTQLGVVSSSKPPIMLLLSSPGDLFQTLHPNQRTQALQNNPSLPFPTLASPISHQRTPRE